MLHSIQQSCAAIGAIVALGACTALSGDPRIDGWPTTQAEVDRWFDEQGIGPGNRKFSGILLGEREAQRDITRYVFNIHGMGKTQLDYNDRMGRELTERFGYRRLSISPPQWVRVSLAETYTVAGEGIVCTSNGSASTSPHAINCSYDTFGQFRIEEFQRDADARAGRPFTERLKVYTYYWHEDLWRIQKPYMAEDLKRPRSLLNGWLKRDMVDYGLSDAAAYLGSMKPVVLEGVRGAVCAMLYDALGQPIELDERVGELPRTRRERPAASGISVPLAGTACLQKFNSEALVEKSDHMRAAELNFISHSLGSRMLLDALSPFAVGGDKTKELRTDALVNIADLTKTFFMAANQIPLFGIGSVDVFVRPPQADTACTNFVLCRAEGAGAAPAELRLSVVGFQDPEDLLGFAPSGGLLGVDPGGGSYSDRPIANIEFTTVQHRNTPVWLFAFAWPLDAHDKELERESAIDLIFCGAVVSGDGRLSPRKPGDSGGCKRLPSERP